MTCKGIPQDRFWLLLRGDRPLALDTDGLLYSGRPVTDLAVQYASHGRSIERLLAAAAPDLLG